MQILEKCISRFWRLCRWLTAGCILMTAQPAAAFAPQAADDVTVWAAPDMQKIRPDDKVESENIVWSEEEGQISVAGAANEHVPFHVVITTPVPQGYEPEAPGGFFIEGTALTSTDGETIGEDQIDFYLEHYIHLYAKSGPIGETGYWPDALAPIQEPFSMEAEYSVVRNRPIWVDLQIPTDTPAGTYTGTITVTQDGETVERLGLEVEVYDFSLPERTHMITYINTSRGRLADFYNMSSSSDRIRELTQTYYDELYANRMEPWFNDPLEPEVSVSGGNVEVAFDEERYDFYMNELNSNRVLLEAFPGALEAAVDGEEFSPAFNEMVRSYLSQLEAFFEEHGWEDRLVINSPIDEPNTAEEYERTRRWGQLIHEATDDVPFLATETPVADDPAWGTLRDDVDNFSVHGNSLNSPEVKEAISEEQAGGGEITWYISCDQGYPQPNYFIDAPAMDPVMVPWITARYGMDGILYWATTHWADTPNPWRDAGSFNSGYFCSGGYVLNGEGYLFYPGDYTEEFTGQPDVDGPVTSIRFELLREGIEDYEYLWMLRNHGAEEFAREQIQNLVVDVSAFSRNVEELYQTRRAMAERLEQLTE